MASYLTVAEADAYFSGVLGASAWSGATAADKEAALATATRKIDRLRLAGRKADEGQELAFPRYGQDAVPQAVKDATCEEALALLEARSDPESGQRRRLQREGVTGFSLGSLSESYGAGSPAKRRQGLLSDEAHGLVLPYVAGSVAIR